MPHSNGRIYTETRNGVRYGVTTEDVAAVLGVESLDVATLCRAANINPWARYKPIPCVQSANNTPQSLTHGQRMQERYGVEPPIDMFTADTIQDYEDYANDIDKHGAYYINMRPWGDRYYHRLLDFVKTDVNRAIVDGVGYDHRAQLDNVAVTVGGTLYRLSPLIAEGSRDLYIPTGEPFRIEFPNDHVWVDEYYKYVTGASSGVQHIETHDEWLSPMDLIGAASYNAQGYPTSYVSVLRGVIIFKRNNQNVWKYVNRVMDMVGGSTYRREYSSSTKNAFLDLTRKDDGGINDIDLYMFNHPEEDTDRNAVDCINNFRTTPPRDYSGHHDNFLWNLEGNYLFVEFWKESNSSTNEIPIPGLTYEVNIYRQAVPPVPADSHVYILNVFEFLGTGSTGTAPIYVDVTSDTSIVFKFYIKTSAFLNAGDVLGNDVEANARLIMTRMQNFYNSFVIKFYDTQGGELLAIDLLSDMIEVSTSDYGDGYKECDAFIYESSSQIGSDMASAKAIASIKESGTSRQGEDDLRISY